MARLNSSGRTIAILVAIVLAALATYALFQYMDGVRSEAFADAELVEVFVATDVIPSGVSAEAAVGRGLFEASDIPREDRPDGAITELSQIEGLVALDRVLPGEILQLGRFGDAASVAGVAMEVPEDREALTVQVGVPEGVAGFVQAGDLVSMIAHIQAPAPTEATLGPDGTPVEATGDAAEETRAQYLLQGVEVLAVGQRVVTTNEEGDTVDEVEQSQVGLYTIAVTPEQAEQVVFAVNEGILHFTLLPEGAEPADTPGRTFDNLFN